MHYPLRSETKEKISAAQTSVPPMIPQAEILQGVIRNAENWRAYCFISGKLDAARTTAVMIGAKRTQLRQLQNGA
jgi:hypothetical protein